MKPILITSSVSLTGCDQKHEEEIDHEAISKNFVLRVSSIW